MKVKVCGIRDADAARAAVGAGAAYLGFVFFPRSPRDIAPDAARAIAAEVPPGVAKVALTVDADDDTLDAITACVPLDMLQLHGSETPGRVAGVRARYGLPVMKAVGVRDASDLGEIDTYGRVADQILVDAKPPEGAALPGGNGIAFDWDLLSGRRWPVPWMLAGGLTRANVADAFARTGARQIDLSSGVESAPGVKDAALIRDFLAAAGAEPRA